ncbi:MAG TPA: hypothetical protein VF272_01235 [Candidatus Saccharimonadia bacterium]
MKRNSRFYAALGLISLIYVLLSLSSPVADSARNFNATTFQFRAIQISVIIPVIIIWSVALWGSLKFKRYAQNIIESQDGQALHSVANGLIALVFGLALNSMIQAVQPLLRGSSYFNEWVIFANYLELAVVLVSFYMIYRGALKLVSLVQFKGFARAQAGVILALVGLGTLYAWLLAMNPYRQASPDITRIVPLYLPDWLIVVSIIVPYLLAWYMGLMAAMSILLYQRNAPGIIYRRSARHLSFGMLAIATSSVLLQMLSAIGPSLSHLGLNSILLILYLLIIAYGFGHIMVAYGAKQLAKLEEAV